MVLFGIVFEKHPAKMPGEKALEFMNAPANPYVAEVGEFIGTQMDHAAYKGMLMSIGLGKEMLDLLDSVREKNPAVFYGAMAVITASVTAAYWLRVPMITATIAGGIITTAA